MPLNIIKDKKEFKPHMAVTSMSLDSGAANQRDIPVIQKAKNAGDKDLELLKRLKLSDDNIVQKASYNNLRNMLSAALREDVIIGGEHCYVYLEDFDESVVIFEHGCALYSKEYSLSEEGVVSLSEGTTLIIRNQVYSKKDTNEVILKGNENNPESSIEVEGEAKGDKSIDPQKPIIIEEEEKEMATEGIFKSQADVDAFETSIIEKARKQFAEEAAAEQLVKSTNTIVKGFSFVEEADVEAIVKGLIASGDQLPVIIKALDAANAAVEAKEAELVVIQKEFADGETKSEEAHVEAEGKKDAESIMKSNIAALKAAKQANK